MKACLYFEDLLSLYIAFVALYFISPVIHGVNIRNIFLYRLEHA
jgi:hypothetical protein